MGAGQQQVRQLWPNVGAWHSNLWMYTLVELWGWKKVAEELCDRADARWDDAYRRPSHADGGDALRRAVLRREYLAAAAGMALPVKISAFITKLPHLAA